MKSPPTSGSFYDDNLKLQPEHIQSLEGRVEQGLGQYFQLSSGVYRNRIDDLITLASVPSDGNFQYQNAGMRKPQEWMLSSAGRATNGLQGKASFDYVDAYSDSAGHPSLDNSPRQMAKLNLIVPLIEQRLLARVEGQFLGRRLTLLQDSLGSYQVFNFTLLGHDGGKTLGRGGQHLQCSGQEIFRPWPPGGSGRRHSTGRKKFADQNHWPVLKAHDAIQANYANSLAFTYDRAR